MSENQGEGNRDAAKRYDDAQKAFVESGKVEQHQKDADISAQEQQDLEKAEAVGKSRAKK